MRIVDGATRQTSVSRETHDRLSQLVRSAQSFNLSLAIHTLISIRREYLPFVSDSGSSNYSVKYS
jgi:hypothetical protein